MSPWNSCSTLVDASFISKLFLCWWDRMPYLHTPYYKSYINTTNQQRNSVWNIPPSTIKWFGNQTSPWPSWRFSQSYSCTSAPLMFFFHGVIFVVQVCPRHCTVGRLSWVEVNPFLPLHAGTHNITQPLLLPAHIALNSTSVSSPLPWTLSQNFLLSGYGYER